MSGRVVYSVTERTWVPEPDAPISGKITAYSVRRYRADAAEQRRRGLKVGGTVTIFCVSDGTRTRYIDAYGPTPGNRRTAAIEAFKRGEGRETEHR